MCKSPLLGTVVACNLLIPDLMTELFLSMSTLILSEPLCLFVVCCMLMCMFALYCMGVGLQEGKPCLCMC